MQILDKILCKHDWKTHTKKVYKWTKREPLPGTEYWYNPIWQKIKYSETVEVLVCKKCGKVKKVFY